MIVKGRRKSKNVERGKPVDSGIKYALDTFGEDVTNAAYPQPKQSQYMGTAKRQLAERRALATGKKMMGHDVGKAMESAAKRDKAAKPKGPRFPKRSRNPYE